MPQEPSSAGGCAAHSASKNAKEKSNNVSMLSRTKAHIQQKTNGRNSRCCSEKDSGYSAPSGQELKRAKLALSVLSGQEGWLTLVLHRHVVMLANDGDAGSDYQQADVDDQHSIAAELRGRKSQSKAEQGNHILVPGQVEFTPMFIIKNVVLKQSGQLGQVHHSLGGSEGTTAQSNLLLLQQPGITVSPAHVRTPQLRRAESKNRKSKSMYLPILNSYPRIAPNLNKKAPEKPQANRKGSSEEHSLSKRVCTKETKKEVSISTQVPEKHSNKQLERHFLSHSHSSLHSLSSSTDSVQKTSCFPTPELENMGTSALMGLNSSTVSGPKTVPLSCPCSSSCSEPAAPLPLISKVSLSAGSVQDSTVGLNRQHCRFLNTVEILSQSGLLDITLRTQELLRQSAVTEQNLTQLRQHTHLLSQTAQAGSSVPSLQKTHRAMLESGCYPNLRRLLFMGTDDRELVAEGSSRNDATATCRCGYGGQGCTSHAQVAPPSPLLTTEAVREGRDLPPADQQDSALSRERSRARGKRLPHNKLPFPPDSSTGEAAVEMYMQEHCQQNTYIHPWIT